MRLPWFSIDAAQLSAFLREFGKLVSAGLPVDQILSSIREDAESPGLRKLVAAIEQDHAKGLPLADSFARQPRHFGPADIRLVRRGEQNATLGAVMIALGERKRRQAFVDGLFRKTLRWPLRNLAVAALVVALLLLTVVPVLGEFYRNFGADLPAPTLALVALADTLPYLLVATAAGLALVSLRRRLGAAGRLIALIGLQVPGLGRLVRQFWSERFLSSAATLASFGVPLVESLQLAAGEVANPALAPRFDAIAGGVESRRPLWECLRDCREIPRAAVRIVRAGEHAGSPQDGLSEAAELHSEAVVDAMIDFRDDTELWLRIAAGVVVGLLAVALYLPLFKLGTLV